MKLATLVHRFHEWFYKRVWPRVRPTRIGRIIRWLIRIVDAYGTHQCSLMACACAYCALLSLVPLLVIGIALLGYVVGGSTAALHAVITAINAYIPINASFLKTTLVRVLQDKGLIGVFGITGFLFAGHQTFLAMQPAMNIIWQAPETRHWLRQRLVALGACVCALVLLGGDLAVTGTVAWARALPAGQVPDLLVARSSNLLLYLLPVLFTVLLLTLLYRLLPARTVPLSSALVGALAASVLWQVTKALFSGFLVYVHSYDRIYGSVSGLVVLVVWMYYSMGILLLGAEIAADHAYTRSGIRAADERAHSEPDLAAATGKRDVQHEPLP